MLQMPKFRCFSSKKSVLLSKDNDPDSRTDLTIKNLTVYFCSKHHSQEICKFH